MELSVLEPLLAKVQKPARYTGGELNSVLKEKKDVSLRYAFCFPDTYEIGMSHLGMKILYSLLNASPHIWCERVFAPDVDMERQMRENNIPLYGLESLDGIGDFDMLGFTLQYELCYTTVLNMLNLAGIPLRQSQREGLSPIVMGGGPCACNPEPMVDFFDLFVLGEGEEVILELCALYTQAKEQDWSRQEYLERASQIQGVYVPSLYEVSYQEDQTIRSVVPLHNAPAKVTKRIVSNLDEVFFPESFVVPYLDVVHDRTMLEVLRGCIRGCRFCQAGFIYRPFREKTATRLNRDACTLTENTGYDEISLTSLSTSDLAELEPLLDDLLPWTKEKRVSLALPSLRIDNFSPELLDKISTVRKTGLTFAPEAGSQRMRDVINKNITEEEVMRTCLTAFQAGHYSVKLYFMMGLPTETEEDIKGIADLAQKVVDLFYNMPERPKGKTVSVTISAACFVPKPFTPFEFEPQDTPAEFRKKQEFLKRCITTKKVSYHYHDSVTSVLEGVLARGDRRLCDVVEAVYTQGGNLEGWSEHFQMERWKEAMEQRGLDPDFYTFRRRSYDEVFPWSHLDYGVSRHFLVEENKLAHQSQTTPNCQESCSACGAARMFAPEEVKAPCKKI